VNEAAVREVLEGLDDEQRAAVVAPAGPVCILAGAGTGKTRAITHRIAWRTLVGEIAARHVLAVTFTSRAAGEMRARLGLLGADGVQARTFHAAALRQLRYFAPRLLGRDLPELVESKARLVTLAAGRCGVRADRATARDLSGEIEWAKSSLVEPAEYPVAAAKAARETPLDPAQVAAVYTAYETVKRSAGSIDFEDLLRAVVWAVEEHPDVADQIRAQYRHFVVDEYQDVTPLQQRLLDAWLGERRDLTVVGDASQTIYSFTGATSQFLLDFPRRHREATVVRLIRDYRSTPQVVGLANAVIRQARGGEARLRLELVGQRPAGPAPEIGTFPDEPAEAAAVAQRCVELTGGGTAPREIAVLFRTNAQSEAYEAALAEAGVPYVVHGAERFFERPEIRQAMVALRAAAKSVPPRTPVPEAVAEALAGTGWRPDQPPPGGAARERWEAQAALLTLAEEFAASLSGGPDASDGVDRADAAESPDGIESPDGVESPDAAEPPGGAERPGGADLPGGAEWPGGTVPARGAAALEAFNAELARRAAAQHAPAVEGVTLSSLHAAKGLEWDAVFLVGLAEGTLPTTYARTPEALEEERRLLYVGVTRARHWLWLSCALARSPGGRNRRPSRFLPVDSAGPVGRARAAGPVGRDKIRKQTAIVACRVCGATLLAGTDRKLGRCASCPSTLDEELFERLREWRARVAGEAKVPAYIVFTDATLTALAERRPSRTEELIDIGGIGPRKLSLYGDAVLALIRGVPADQVAFGPSTEK
jgi:DNA helicase II / ATP-dependent DNA helicase PcrA